MRVTLAQARTIVNSFEPPRKTACKSARHALSTRKQTKTVAHPAPTRRPNLHHTGALVLPCRASRSVPSPHLTGRHLTRRCRGPPLAGAWRRPHSPSKESATQLARGCRGLPRQGSRGRPWPLLNLHHNVKEVQGSSPAGGLGVSPNSYVPLGFSPPARGRGRGGSSLTPMQRGGPPN